MALDPKRPKGRPPTTPLERMRVVAWSMHVQSCSSLKTAEEFEQLLNRKGKRTVITKGQWSRHLRGDVTPQGAKVGATNSLVDRIEPFFPGTRQTFSHPVWRLLDFEVLLGPKQLQEIYLEMDRDIWEYFHFDEDFCEEGTQPKDFWFWRPATREPGLTLEYLKDIHGLDGVAVSLIEARMAYLAQIPSEFVFFIRCAISKLRKCPSTLLFMGGAKGQSLLLTMEGLCILHAAQLLTDEAKFDPESLAELQTIPNHMSSRMLVGHLYESWGDRSLNHLMTLPSKAARTFRAWNREVIQYQGLFNWSALDAA